MRLVTGLLVVGSSLALLACDGDDVGTQEEFATGGVQENTREARAVLAVANQLDLALLAASPDEGGVGLSERAADNVVAYRLGDDEEAPSDDDERFETLKELDAVPRVGPDEFKALLRFARDHGFLEPPAQPAGSGEVIWATDLGGVGQVMGIAADGDRNVVFAGSFDGTLHAGLDAQPIVSAGKKDGFVAKVGPDGAPLWSRAIGTPENDDVGTALVDAQGEVLVTTWSWRPGVVDAGCGATDLPTNTTLLVKLDRDGACRWSRTVPIVRARAALAADGRVAVIGLGKPLTLLDAEGEIAATRDVYLDNPSLAFGPDGELAVAGHGPDNDFGGGPIGTNGQFGLQIAELGPDLAHVWSQVYPSVRTNTATAVAFGPDGALIVATGLTGVANLGGSSLGHPDGTSTVVAALTTDGAHLWSIATRMNGGQHDTVLPREVRVGAEGAIYVGGHINSIGAVAGLLLKLEPGGRQAWVKAPGASLVIDTDVDGRVLVGGRNARSMLGIPNAGGFFGVLTP